MLLTIMYWLTPKTSFVYNNVYTEYCNGLQISGKWKKKKTKHSVIRHTKEIKWATERLAQVHYM